MPGSRIHKSNWLIWLIIIAGTVCGLVAGAFIALLYDLPQIRSLENYRPSAVTKIFSADKVLLDELFVEQRLPVPLAAIPDYLKTALITTEDRTFYSHSGIDFRGVLRAIWKDIRAGGFVEGASTITQQLAKTLFLTPKKSIVRKLREALLAVQLERRYTKDEILELYLNQIYLGSGAYGVESAARIYFGKSVHELTLAQCALIAAMPKAPSRYSPRVDLGLARKRRDIVLRQLLDTAKIPLDLYEQASRETIVLASRKKDINRAPYFVAYVEKLLEENIGQALFKDGLTVYTTLSYELQKAAEVAVNNGISSLAARIKDSHHPVASEPQCALIALDVQTGSILAMVGGKDFSESAFNRATAARRQPGSAFKPFVYAYAIEQGYPQSRLILDSPIIFKGAKDGDDWRPENFSGTYQGEMTLRRALSLSRNIPAVRLIEMLGPSSVVRFARTLGIESDLKPNLTLALGASETTLIELTSAYAAFPNRGKHIKPLAIEKILDRSGRILWRASPQATQAMSRTGAAVMTDMLQAVIKEGTAKKAKQFGRPVAGKTGTTNDFKDALFIGFSPSIAAGVWVGHDNFTTLGPKETGSRAALPVWIEFMAAAFEKRSSSYFDIPDDVVRLPIHTKTGAVVQTSAASGVAWALFKKETAPR